MSVVEQGSGDRGWQSDLEAHHVIDAELAGITTAPGRGTAQPHLRCLFVPITLLLPTVRSCLPPPAALLMRVSRRTRQVVGLRVVTSTVAIRLATFQNPGRRGVARDKVRYSRRDDVAVGSW